MKTWIWNGIWFLVAVFFGCMTYNFRTEAGGQTQISDETPSQASRDAEVYPKDDWTPLELSLAQEGKALTGRNSLSFPDRRFNLDCTGVVLANYHQSGLSLWPYLSGYSGGGVERLYAWLQYEGLLFEEPRLGDLIFWDNTYDSNNDYRWNDPLTHVGVVVNIAEDGQITYLHHNYRRGIVQAQMNLRKPDIHQEGGLEINSPMRMSYPDRPRAEKWLSSHLFKAFGRPSLGLKKDPP
jgi:hypothetical protein